MASTTQDEIYKTFAAISGKHSSNLDETANSLADLVVQISKMQTDRTPQIQSQGSTPAPQQSALSTQGVQATRQDAPAPQQSATSAQGRSTAATVESIASTVLKSGFGIVPLVSELLGLFGGGGSPAPPSLVKYAMPPAIDFEAAETTSGLSNSDYDQWGMPRAYSAGAASGNGTASTDAARSGAASGVPSTAGAKGSSGSPAPQITVNVQAMDARSFLDRSNDIAAAVRDAMLNLNAINDVVNDL